MIHGTATDYRDLSDLLVAAATGSSLTVATVTTAGTGYVVGDILTISGGTYDVQAQVEVTAVSGGAVTAVRLYNQGIYSVTPGSPNSVGGGSGSGCQLTLTWDTNGWTANRNTGTEISAVDSVASGGSGYSVNDIITLAGGVYKTQAQLRVTSESSGVITGVSIEEPGYYEVPPADSVVQSTVSPGGGTGAEFNLSWEDGEKIVLLEGEGGGTDEIYTGWRTLSDSVSGYYNWELHGMTGHNTALDMENQPGISPGFHDQALSSLRDGAYVLLHNTTIEFWFNITSYRIQAIVRVGTAYFNFYMGWGNRFATVTEYPYPMIVAGHVSSPFLLSNQSALSSGLTDPWRSDGTDTGPMLVYFTDGQWYGVCHGEVSSSARTVDRERVVMPAGWPAGSNDGSVGSENKFMGNNADFTEIIPYTGLSNTPVANLQPTPGTADFRVMLPCPIIFFSPSQQVVMELDGIFWVSGFGAVASEDRIIVSDEVYRVFQNCNRTDNYAYLAIKEI